MISLIAMNTLQLEINLKLHAYANGINQKTCFKNIYYIDLLFSSFLKTLLFYRKCYSFQSLECSN